MLLLIAFISFNSFIYYIALFFAREQTHSVTVLACDLIRERKMETESRTPFIKKRAYWVHQSPPPLHLNRIRCLALRGAIKNLILVGTIIMLVALVRVAHQ